jgi:RHS repeat-associated protein
MGSGLPADPTYDSRTGNEPLEYKATQSITFLPGFESGDVNDTFVAYITTGNGGGSGGSGSGNGSALYAEGGYRYGFNGKENDNDVKGVEGSQQDYGLRIYDTRLGRFLSVDPLVKGYPMLTPFQFASNCPIAGVDIDGGEFKYYTLTWQPNADGKSHLSVDKKINLINRSFRTSIIVTGINHPVIIVPGSRYTPPIFGSSDKFTVDVEFTMKDLGMSPSVVSPDGKTWKVIPSYMDLYDLPAFNDPIWNTLESPDQYTERLIDDANKALVGAKTVAQAMSMLHGSIKNGKLGADKKPNEIGAPEGWIVKPSKKGGGTRYIDPKNSRNVIREMPGDPSSPFPSQKVPYVKFQKNGRFYDKDGNPLSGGDLPEAHIPKSEFDISKMPKFEER